MPWQSIHASNTTCTRYSELQKILQRLDKISDMDDIKFQDKTGCIAPCTTREFKTRKIYHTEEGMYRVRKKFDSSVA